MEAFSLPSPAINVKPTSSGRVPSGRPASLFSVRPSVGPFAGCGKRCPDVTNRSLQHLNPPRASAMVPSASGSSVPEVEGNKQEIPSKEEDIVFVAGATGRVGSRTVRELLKLGFQVRAGVRSAQRAEALVQSMQKMNLDGASATGTQPEKRLEIVECDLENPGEIRPAIGNASIVICCIGASEKEIFDISGPYRIDYQATKNLIDAATFAKINHFILLTSLGTGKIGFPAALLNLFWGVLTWKKKAEEALIASGLPYTIVRPGGMERPTDAFKETHNLILAPEDTYFGGLVSNLQVAELMAVMAKNTSLSFCKVVEVIAETTAPLTPMEELLSKIPSQQVDTSVVEEPRAKPEPDPASVSVSSGTDQLKPQKPRPLSPYTAYEDLKPPTSPSPCAPGSNPSASLSRDNGPPTSVAVAKEDLKPEKTELHSPFTMYEDLKPHPTPSAPVSKPFDSKSAENDVLVKEKSRPLSPYTMYDDMKPPSSPSPSKPKY